MISITSPGGLPGAMRPAVVAAASLLAAMSPRVARAEGAPPRTASLSWVRPAEADTCVATRALARAVDERLGRRVIVSASEADLSVEASVERVADPPGWRAVVNLRDAEGRSLGSREIASAGPSCESLRAPLAVVIAVLIDPEASLAPRKPSTPAPAPPVAEPTPAPSTPARPCAPPKERWSASAWAGAATSAGLLPAIGLGATVGARLTPPHFWALELHGVWWAPQSLPAERGAAVSFALAYAGIGLCPLALGSPSVSFTGCFGARLGSLRAAPSGFDVEAAHEQLVADVTASGRLSVPIVRPLVLLAGVTLGAALRRDDVRYEQPSGGERSLFRPAPVSAAADLALGVRFP